MENLRIKTKVGGLTKSGRRMIAAKPTYQFLKNTQEGHTPEKDKTRTELVNMIKEWVRHNDITKIKAITLPGVHWLFEKELNERMFRHHKHVKWRGKDHKMVFTEFKSFERDLRTFEAACSNIPVVYDHLDPYVQKHVKAKGYSVQAYKHDVILNRLKIGSNAGISFTYADVFDWLEAHERYPMHKRLRKYNLVWLDSTSTVVTIAPRLQLFKQKLAENCFFAVTIIKGREAQEIVMERADIISAEMRKMGFRIWHKWEYKDSSPMITLAYARKYSPETYNLMNS